MACWANDWANDWPNDCCPGDVEADRCSTGVGVLHD